MAGMKSALELAMEKLNAQKSQEESTVALTDAQRQEISDLRKQYDAKIAEKEIMMQSEIRQLIQRRPPQEAIAAAPELREKVQHTNDAVREERQRKIVGGRPHS